MPSIFVLVVGVVIEVIAEIMPSILVLVVGVVIEVIPKIMFFILVLVEDVAIDVIAKIIHSYLCWLYVTCLYVAPLLMHVLFARTLSIVLHHTYDTAYVL